MATDSSVLCHSSPGRGMGTKAMMIVDSESNKKRDVNNIIDDDYWTAIEMTTENLNKFQTKSRISRLCNGENVLENN